MHRRLLVSIAVALLSGCGGTPVSSTAPTTAARDFTVVPRPAPERVVVLVPGGGWASADPAGLEPLAQALIDHRVMAVTVTFRAGDDGVYFPETVTDLACAIAAVAADAAASEIIVVGHSSGAHLASLVALRPQFGTGCPHEAIEIDRFIGLAGPYEVSQWTPMAGNLFGTHPPADPFEAANPLLHAARRPDMPVLLVHGEADTVVPLRLSESFAAALRDGGHEVTTRYLDGVGHHDIYAPEPLSTIIREWLEGD